MTPTPPANLQHKRRFNPSAALLALWVITGGAAFVFTLFDTQQAYKWSALALMGSGLFILALWFSIQGDIVRHYQPHLPSEEWTMKTGSGLLLGGLAGAAIGFGGVAASFSLTPGVVSYESERILLLASVGAGLLAGSGVLGWQQVRALGPYCQNVDGAIGWAAVTA